MYFQIYKDTNYLYKYDNRYIIDNQIIIHISIYILK